MTHFHYRVHQLFPLLLSIGCSGRPATSLPIPLPQPSQPQAPTAQTPVAVSWTINYSSGSSTYRIARTATIETQSDSRMRRESASNTTYETVTLDSAAPGQVMVAAQIDTFAVTAPGAAGTVQPVQLPTRLSGVFFGDSLVLTSTTGSEKCSPVSSTLASDLHSLLIHFPSPVTPTMAWRDSVEITGCQATIPTRSQVLRSYRVSGEVMHDGMPMLEILRVDTVRALGEGAQQQHRVILEGRGIGKASYYIDPVSSRIVRIVSDQDLSLTVTTGGKPQQFRQRSQQELDLLR